MSSTRFERCGTTGANCGDEDRHASHLRNERVRNGVVELERQLRRGEEVSKHNQSKLAEHYAQLFRQHGDSPEAVQLNSEGQRFRFEKLVQIADLSGCSILDVGCGLGHLYPFIISKVGPVSYTGVDIVPDSIEFAARKYPAASFVCRDIIKHGLDAKFDYVLSSGVCNNNIQDVDHTRFMLDLVTAAFAHCTKGLGFNFISTHVNFRDAEMAYHDPVVVLDYCIRNLSRKVVLSHHYERCDVSVFIYR